MPLWGMLAPKFLGNGEVTSKSIYGRALPTGNRQETGSELGRKGRTSRGGGCWAGAWQRAARERTERAGRLAGGDTVAL